MNFNINAIYLALWMANLGILGTISARRHNYNQKDGYPEELVMDSGSYMPAVLEDYKEAMLDHSIENIDYTETSPFRIEALLREIKIESVAKECRSPGTKCSQVLDCCSLQCFWRSKKCL